MINTQMRSDITLESVLYQFYCIQIVRNKGGKLLVFLSLRKQTIGDTFQCSIFQQRAFNVIDYLSLLSSLNAS